MRKLTKGQKNQGTAKNTKPAKKQPKPQSADEKEYVVKAYNWPDEEDNLLAQHLRYEPKRFGWRRPNPDNPPDLKNPADLNDPADKKHWHYNLDDPDAALVKKIPYRVGEHIRAMKDRPRNEPTCFVEGEHDYHTCWDEDLFAMTFAGGANVWLKDYNVWFPLDRPILIFVHNDKAGKGRGRIAARSLADEKPDRVIKIILLPGLSEGEDVSDWFGKGHTIKELKEVIEKTPVFVPPKIDERKTTSETSVDFLMDLCTDTELFHDQYNKGYVVVPIGNHHEVFSLSSKSFGLWLTARYFSHKQQVPHMQTLNEAIATLQGLARFNRPQQLVDVRLAEHKGKLYLDLGDPEWRTVEIDVYGWRIVTNPPVYFRRPPGLAALPEPVQGGSIEPLRQFVNMKDSDWILLVGWILGTYQPVGPYPILCITGEQGSGKTIMCRLVQDLIDPSKAKLRSLPRSEHDLMLAAQNNRVLAFDNVSIISPAISDALCRLSTSGAYATRKLYTDDEEKILVAQRAIISNGIVQAANRPDLLDRMICLTSLSIPDQDRLKERVLFAEFEKHKPSILGAFLDGVSCALQNFDILPLSNLPRMADFACWVEAGLPEVGILREKFLKAYAGNRLEIDQLALEGSPLSEVLKSLMAARQYEDWHGTASQLYYELDQLAEADKVRHQKAWPKSASHLSRQLKRLVPNLRRVGIHVNFNRIPDKNRVRIIDIVSRLHDES